MSDILLPGHSRKLSCRSLDVCHTSLFHGQRIHWLNVRGRDVRKNGLFCTSGSRSLHAYTQR